jgi:CRISPR/Cas system-associated protein endoribonuclease Cas2
MPVTFAKKPEGMPNSWHGRIAESTNASYAIGDKELYKYLITRLSTAEKAAFKEIFELIEKEAKISKSDILEIFSRHVGSSDVNKCRLNKILRSIVDDGALKILPKTEKEMQSMREFWARVHTAPPKERIGMLENAGLIKENAVFLKRFDSKSPKQNVSDLLGFLAKNNQKINREEISAFLESAAITPQDFRGMLRTHIAEMKLSNGGSSTRLAEWEKIKMKPEFAAAENQADLSRFIREEKDSVIKNNKKIAKAGEILGVLNSE